jgi:cytochrome c oxidase cbb3-type subunit 3
MNGPRKHDPIQGEIIHEYDGIEEADNRLPFWWLMTFFGAIVFSVGYWFYYQEFHAGASPTQAYYAERAAAAEKNGVDPSEGELVALAEGPGLELGKQLFAANCVACHASQGEGKIGPNLTDDAWLHGSAPVEIFRTVRDGVAEKGMPAWGAALGRAGATQVTAFVLTLRGKNLPGKAPEGQRSQSSTTTSPAPTTQAQANSAP